MLLCVTIRLIYLAYLYEMKIMLRIDWYVASVYSVLHFVNLSSCRDLADLSLCTWLGPRLSGFCFFEWWKGSGGSTSLHAFFLLQTSRRYRCNKPATLGLEVGLLHSINCYIYTLASSEMALLDSLCSPLQPPLNEVPSAPKNMCLRRLCYPCYGKLHLQQWRAWLLHPRSSYVPWHHHRPRIIIAGTTFVPCPALVWGVQVYFALCRGSFCNLVAVLI
jgi:hypothetical protein